jgi:hypothetical protein
MKTADTAAVEFSDADFNAADEADMTVVMNGKATSWVWTFAGPGHPKTVEQSNRIARERLHRERLQEQARVNGKKWVAPEDTVEETRARNVQQIVERLVRWSPVKINGEDYPFTAENATRLLSDPRKVGLYVQALEFLAADNSFTPRSGTE